MPKRGNTLRRLVGNLRVRLDGIDRDLQTRATGANVHMIANIRTSIRGALDNVASIQPMIELLSEFPAVIDMFSQFLRRVSEAVRDGELTIVEIQEIERLWIDLSSVVSVFVASMRRLPTRGESPCGGGA